MPTNDVYIAQISALDPDFKIEGFNNAQLGKTLTGLKTRFTELSGQIKTLSPEAQTEGLDIPSLVTILASVDTPENKQALADKTAADAKAAADKKIADKKIADDKKVADKEAKSKRRFARDKEAADKAAAEKKIAIDKEAAEKKFPYYVNVGKSVTCKKGIVPEGGEIKAEWLGGGKDALDKLVGSGYVVKS